MKLAICGLGRCGTTAMMTMLDAGGVPVHGEPPAYEPGRRGRADLPDYPCAYKLLNPHEEDLPAPAAVAIYLSRDILHQAVSSVRFFRVLQGGGTRVPRGERRRMAARLRKETPLARAALTSWLGTSPREWTFEDLVTDPGGTAAFLADCVREAGLGELDTDAAASVVHVRPPTVRLIPFEVMGAHRG